MNKTRFKLLQDRASLQGCVLERDIRNGFYTLASNRTFTAGEFSTLDEIVDALACDSSFHEFATQYDTTQAIPMVG